MAETAQIIQFLLSPVAATGVTLSNGTVTFYAAGTSTPKTIWLDRSKATPAANPYTLDANGTAQLYADGVYRVVVKDSTGSVKYDRDYLNFADNSSDISAINTSLDEKIIENVSEHADIAAAIAAIGSTPTTLAYGVDQTLTANLVVPSHIDLFPYNGAVINHGAYSVSYAGITARWSKSQVFSGIGTVTGITDVCPEWFGAKGDGVTDDTAPLQKALSLNGESHTVIHIAKGKSYLHTGLTLTAKNKTITGGGELTGGILTVGVASLPDVGSNVPLFFDINGVTFSHPAVASGKHCIQMQHVGNGKIRNCTFRNFDTAIYGMPHDHFQHVRRITIDNNIFDVGNYCFVMDRPAGYTSNFVGGDIHITNNQAYGGIHYTHVYAKSMDGLLVSHNTFFFPGYTDDHPTKNSNIIVDMGAFINIVGNQLFEAGTDAVVLTRCQNFAVTGNNIPWPGQRVNSCGIRINGGSPTGSEYSQGTITGNTIQFPTDSGISIEDNCAHIAVTGNVILTPGNLTYFYGTDDTALTHYGIKTGSSTKRIAHSGNLTTADPGATRKNLFQGGSVWQPEQDTDGFTKTYSGIETELSVLGLAEIRLSQSAATVVTGLTDGVTGQVVTLVAFNGNTTVQNNAGMYLKLGANVTLAVNQTLTLRLAAGKWYEIGRNF